MNSSFEVSFDKKPFVPAFTAAVIVGSSAFAVRIIIFTEGNFSFNIWLFY